MSPSTAISSRCVCCTTALLSVDIFPCFSRRTRWRRRSSVRLSDRQLAQNYLRLFVVGLFLHVRLQRQKRALLFGVSFVVLCGFAVNVWRERKLTRHSTQYSEVGAERHDMVVPIHEEKSVQKLQFYAVASKEVGAKRAKGNELRHFWPGAHCCLHAVVDLDLKVEELAVLCLCLCQLVEEIVKQEEMIE